MSNLEPTGSFGKVFKVLRVDIDLIVIDIIWDVIELLDRYINISFDAILLLSQNVC